MNSNGLEAAPGKVQDLIKIEGTHVKIPMTVITGEKSGPTVFVTTGLHGSEYPGTMAMIELALELEPALVSGRLIAFHPVNSQAFWTRISSILPEDGADLNRVFPGRPDGGVSEKTAWRVTEFQDLADFYLDLHSGDLYEDLSPFACCPLTGSSEVTEVSRQAARLLNVGYLTGTDRLTGAVGSAASRGTPALLINRGGGGQCRREDVDLYKKDVLNLFKHFGLLAGQPDPPASPPRELGKTTYLEAGLNALWQPLVSVGQEVRPGQPLGRLFDFFGKTVATFQAEHEGVVLCCLRTLAANAGDVLVVY